MNIMDMLSGARESSGCSLSNKIAKNSEIRKIEKRAEDFADQVAMWISDEANFIEKGLTYGSVEGSKLSDEDKKELLNKLKEVAKTVSGKVASTVNDIFSDSEEKKEENKEEEKPEEAKEVELKVEAQPVQIPQTTTQAVFPSFGY